MAPSDLVHVHAKKKTFHLIPPFQSGPMIAVSIHDELNNCLKENESASVGHNCDILKTDKEEQDEDKNDEISNGDRSRDVPNCAVTSSCSRSSLTGSEEESDGRIWQHRQGQSFEHLLSGEAVGRMAADNQDFAKTDRYETQM